MGNSYVPIEDGNWESYVEGKKKESIKTATGIYDSQIADTANKSAHAGSVQGISNPGKLSADAYSRITSEKSKRISAITDQYNNYAIGHKLALERQNALNKQQWEMNKPNALNWLSTVGQIGASVFTGGAAAGLFGGKPKNPGQPGGTNPLPPDQSNINYTPPLSGDTQGNNFMPLPPSNLSGNQNGFNNEFQFDPRIGTSNPAPFKIKPPIKKYF